MEDKLSIEILRELKKESQRRFIILIIVLILFFATNAGWLIAWNLPDRQVTESYELAGEDDANVVYNSEGEVRINEPNQSNEENSYKNK